MYILTQKFMKICFSISSGFVIGWSEYIGNFFYMILSFVDGWFRESVMARLIPNRHSYLYSSMSSKLLSKGLHSRLKNSNIIRKQIESINPSRIRRKCKMFIVQYLEWSDIAHKKKCAKCLFCAKSLCKAS